MNHRDQASVARSVRANTTLPQLSPLPFPEIHPRRLPCTRQPELWHSTKDPDKERARKLCWRCPALRECRQAGREGREFGIWGGEDERDRSLVGRAPVCWRPGKYDYDAGARA
ncbi:WhiB family transcriptional regulator [Streptomyces sp. NPDC001404]|uniref:WhiB family transcriptional regulator n=1 Tax=Streptomyces sp. NPDC001404 TaxID=3364571 RepID=UPI00368EF0E4